MATAGSTLRPTSVHGWKRIATVGAIGATLVGLGFAAGRTSAATPSTVGPASTERIAPRIELPDRSTLAFDHTQRVKWG
jgi:hypothetical protein